MNAAHLVYAAAGNPEREDFEPVEGPCWWCGSASPTGRGWPLKRLSDNFQDAHLASLPNSDIVCAPCAWSMAVGFHLPADYARKRLRSKAEQGRRVDLEMNGERIKRLALVLEDGRIGLWTTASGGKEKAWQDAVKADLTANPRTIGPCEYLGAHALDSLTPGADRFIQSFHHWVVDGVWTACTDADKPAVRSHLLRQDIRGPACTSLALAQGKHTLIHTPLEYPETGTRTIYALGVLHYRPEVLAELLWAFESLRLAGASSEDILAGTYGHGGLALLRARWECELLVAPHRGSRLLDLTAYLCRPWPALQESPPVRSPVAPGPSKEVPRGRLDLAAGRPPAPLSDVASRPGSEPAHRPTRPASGARQLTLF